MILVEITTIIIIITTTVVEVITVMVREVPMGAVAVGAPPTEAVQESVVNRSIVRGSSIGVRKGVAMGGRS